jgi:hypothetical protein
MLLRAAGADTEVQPEGWIVRKMYIVRLTETERTVLRQLIAKPRAAAQKVRRAHVLLKADADGPQWTDARIAEAFDCSRHAVELIRERFATAGFDLTLHGRPKSRVRGKVLDGEQEAQLIALRLGPPPAGFANWTLRLLASQAVELSIADALSHETVRRILKKQHDAAQNRILGDSAVVRRRVRRGHGSRAGRVRAAL